MTLSANDRIKLITDELIGEAFCADWHDDPDMGVREIDRIRKLFTRRIMEFACSEIILDRASQLTRPTRGTP
jgi:hypothetical protein